jgi:GT2 family glycosyltransferase
MATVGAFFRDHPDVDIVYSHRVFIDHFGKEIGRAILPGHDPIAIKWADYIPQETMFWRRKVWDESGPLDESYRYAMDWDFILRAQRGGFKFRRLPTFLAAFRVHDAQKTTTIRDLGEVEQMRLRQIHLGFVPSYRDIKRAMRPYLRRHVVHTRLYRLGLLK